MFLDEFPGPDRKAYAGMLHTMDSNIGRIQDKLDMTVTHSDTAGRPQVLIRVLLLYLLIAVIAIVLIYFFLLSYSSKLFDKLVQSKHHDAEAISGTGLVPPHWNRKLVVRLSVPLLARSYALWRLGRIIQYFRNSPLVDDEQTRRALVLSLEEVDNEWKQKQWNEMTPWVE